MPARFFSCLLALTLVTAASCATLPTFGSDLGKQQVAGTEQRPPYAALASYYGYIKPGSDADEVRDGKKMYYLYLWIPAVAPELGVRMLSPVKGSGAKPGPNDFVDPEFVANADSAAYFDTWVRFERCLAAVNPDDITRPCAQWVTFGENDDSAELPAQPSGNKYNSVLRVATSPDDPLKALVRGLYRVGFTTYKVGDVQGTFLAQVGSPVDMAGVAIARSAAELAKGITDKSGSAPPASNP